MLKLLLARLMVRRSGGKLYSEAFLEQKHVNLGEPYPNDSSYYYGSDATGFALISRMAFRGPDRSKEYWFDFHIPGRGFFGLRQDPGPEGAGFQMGSLLWEPVEIGRKWRLRYDGPVRDGQGAEHRCEAELLFEGAHPLADYTRLSDPEQAARAIAREPWSRAFFMALKDTHQIHYEQTGTLRGTLVLDGQVMKLDLRASRDHSFGSRNWLTWDRHYWFNGISDGGEHFTVTNIKWQFLSGLTAGFVTGPDGATEAIAQATPVDELQRGVLKPEQGKIEIKMRSGKTRLLEFERRGEFPYLHDGKYHMREGIAFYRLDGVPALGMAEYGYHADRHAIR